MSQVYKADIPTPQGFLDYEGVKHLWSKVSMKDYPNNETLAAVINAIDETKADKSELFSGSWNDLSDKPFGEGACQITVYNHPKEQIPFVVVDGSEIGLWDPVEIIVGGITFIKILDFGIGLDAVQRATIDGEYIYPPYYWKQTEYTDQYVKTEHIVSVYEGDVTLIFTPVAGEFSKGTYLNKYYLEQGEVIIPENKLIDEKFIPDTIARVSDIPVDTVTNSELHSIAKSGSWNDLEDKPFGEVNLFEIIYENSRVGGGPAIFEDGYSVLPLSSIIPDETYVVTVDGVDYIGIAEWNEDASSDGGNGVRLFGNFSDFSDAPINISSYGNYIYFSFVDDSIPYSVKITHVTKNIQVLDDRFISDNIARVSDIPKELTTEDAIALATETGLIDPIATTSDNTILTDVNNNIITL